MSVRELPACNTVAKSGDTINVTLTASEPIQSASSTIFARTANVVISGNTVKLLHQ